MRCFTALLSAGAATAALMSEPFAVLAQEVKFDGKLRQAADGSVEAYMDPPYASNHASTLEVLPDGTLAAAWFSGEHEEAPGCAIVVATLAPGATKWSQAITVSKDDKFSNQNPVLFHDEKDSTLHLFHSHAPAEAGESQSTIYHLTSSDKGKSWTEPKEWLSAPGGFPRNRILPTPNGGVIFPFYNASSASPQYHDENYVIMGISGADRDWNPSTWDFLGLKGSNDLVQPSVVQYSGNHSMVSFFRDRRAQSIYRAEADSSGRSWTVPDTSTGLPNNNAGIEANIITSSNRIVLAFNPQTSGRDPLAVALSDDGGHTWAYQRDIQHGDSELSSSASKGKDKNEFSYPSTLVTYDAKTGAPTVHVTYTYNRDTIKYKRFDEAWVINGTVVPWEEAEESEKQEVEELIYSPPTVEELPSAQESFDQWVSRQMLHHQELQATGQLKASGAAATLPAGCNYTLPNQTTTVLCVSNSNSANYDPVGQAANISAVPGIQALSFAVDVAPVQGTALTDLTLGQVAANLNSTTVTTLHVFIGTLAFVSDDAITAFTALNPIARHFVTNLGFALERNQLSDENVGQIGNILGRLYPMVEHLDLDIANQFSSNLTGSGIALMMENMIFAHSVSDFWLDVSGNDITDNLAETGKLLGQWGSLRQLNFTNRNRAQGPQVDDEGFLSFVHSVFFRAANSPLTNFTFDFSFNNITDAGLVVTGALFGSNLTKVIHLGTVLDFQQQPITPQGIAGTLDAMGVWAETGTWDLSILQTPKAAVAPASIIEQGSAIANLTDALSCAKNQNMFNIGAKLVQLQMPPNASYCDAMAIAAPSHGGNSSLNGTCPTGSLRLGFSGKFVDECNLTMYYCGNCSRAPHPHP